MEYEKIMDGPSMEISREELANVAYMCYVLNHTETTKWFHRWRTSLERMANEGWTWDGLHLRGLFVQKLEQIYGLTPRQSRTAVKQYPPVNMGVESWQVLTERSVNEIAEKIYRAYVGLPQEKGPDFCSGSSRAGNEGSYGECADGNTDMSMTCTDDDEDMGGFSFL